MEDGEWRELALTVPGTLMLVGTSQRALQLIYLGYKKFAWDADVMHRIRNGAKPDDIEPFADPDPSRPSPPATVILDVARCEISRCSALHAEAYRVFVHYTAHFGLHANPRWQSWNENHSAAISYTGEALKKLRAAASFAEAADDVVSITPGVPNWTPLWRAWMRAAEQLLKGAAKECVAALLMVRRTQRAVVLEFFDSWMILNR